MSTQMERNRYIVTILEANICPELTFFHEGTAVGVKRGYQVD